MVYKAHGFMVGMVASLHHLPTNCLCFRVYGNLLSVEQDGPKSHGSLLKLGALDFLFNEWQCIREGRLICMADKGFRLAFI